jgi:hypothetical protein
MKLVPNWKQYYKAFSMQALAFIAFLQGVMVVLPASALDARVPFIEMSYRDVGVALTVAAAILGGIGRLIDQKIPESA